LEKYKVRETEKLQKARKKKETKDQEKRFDCLLLMHKCKNFIKDTTYIENLSACYRRIIFNKIIEKAE